MTSSQTRMIMSHYVFLWHLSILQTMMEQRISPNMKLTNQFALMTLVN